MNAPRCDILHINGHRFLKRLSVITNSADAQNRIRKTVVDLGNWGFRFVVRSELDDSVLVDHHLAAGTDHTIADADRNGEIASVLLDIGASDMTFNFTAPALERTIPVRYLPYILTIDDGSNPTTPRTDVLCHGYLVVRAKVTP